MRFFVLKETARNNSLLVGAKKKGLIFEGGFVTIVEVVDDFLGFFEDFFVFKRGRAIGGRFRGDRA